MNKELLISNLRFRINVVFDLYHVISGGDGIPGIACFTRKVACPLFKIQSDSFEAMSIEV